MYHNFDYQATLASSLRAQWKLDDVLREDQELDFSRAFMGRSGQCVSLAQTDPFWRARASSRTTKLIHNGQ